ncbi:S1 RNA-binding domain-containing protein [Streptomyces sp. SD11]|uniref:S1 RNA-binding domain-containing protein n=1 Tax=Streptomyces sp. SD11 TaxID=3452209 RepID=UPI003F88BFB2
MGDVSSDAAQRGCPWGVVVPVDGSWTRRPAPGSASSRFPSCPGGASRTVRRSSRSGSVCRASLLSGLASAPVETPDEVVQVGDQVLLMVTDIDAERRRLLLSRRRA